jgi:glutamine synthetase
MIIAEYVWIDGSKNLRSKIKILNKLEFPLWNFDGSSTGQATGPESDIILCPVAIYDNPFFEINAKLVLCECLNKDMKPHKSNTRHECEKAFEIYKDYESLFGIEQEYMILDRNNKPYKWLSLENPGIGSQGPYYCSVGGDRNFGREISNEHLVLCLKAGVSICGTNSEVLASQWEFQIGTCDMIKVSDDLIIARYILLRLSEKYNCYISFHPKPLEGWNGSGGHTNFSTRQMRENDGIKHIIEACKLLEDNHIEHIKVYGEDNDKRLSGKYETSSIDNFSYGIANRSCSIRIPLQVAKDGCGYLEDRRPAANLDPYLVTTRLVKTICN